MKKNVKVKYPIFIFTDVAFFTGVQSCVVEITSVSYKCFPIIIASFKSYEYMKYPHDFSGYHGRPGVS